MPLLILLIFIAVPIAEIAVFIRVGDLIGLWPTLLLVILTAVIGVALLKRQGLAVIAEARGTLDAGGLPVQSVLDGACLLVAGAFLLTPGLLTDTAGFLLLVPAVRRRLGRWLVEKIKASKNIDVHVAGGSPRRPRPDTVIEGEFSAVDDDAPDKGGKPRDGSPWRRR